MDKNDFIDKLKHGDSAILSGYDFFFIGNRVLAPMLRKLVEGTLQDSTNEELFGELDGDVTVTSTIRKISVTARTKPRRVDHSELPAQLMANRKLCESLIQYLQSHRDELHKTFAKKVNGLSYDGSECYVEIPDSDSEKFTQAIGKVLRKSTKY